MTPARIFAVQRAGQTADGGASRSAVRNFAADDRELYLYGDIGLGPDGLYAADVAKAIASIKGSPDISIRINSPGGDVFEGVAIYEALSRYPGKVIAHIDGLAASAASAIAMAADEIHIAKAGFLMIHRALGGVLGFADDMRATADLLDKISDRIANAYAERTRIDRAEIMAMMTAETWLDADEALRLGFVDHIAKGRRAPSPVNSLDRYGYQHTPQAVRAWADKAAPKPALPLNEALALVEARVRVRALAHGR